MDRIETPTWLRPTIITESTELHWQWHDAPNYQWSAQSSKWLYFIAIDQESLMFEASRFSVNDALWIYGIGTLHDFYDAVAPAKAVVESWHAKRYEDYEDEFQNMPLDPEHAPENLYKIKQMREELKNSSAFSF
jgi:hypothetical protein